VLRSSIAIRISCIEPPVLVATITQPRDSMNARSA
jgi:hypothetical protein